jgi:2-oxoglutarate ferredoxin oxidoreductase subunit beta
LVITDVATTDPEKIITHDVHGRPSLAFALTHLATGPTMPTCIGVFREEKRTVYGEALEAQIEDATDKMGPGDLHTLLRSGDIWEVKDPAGTTAG